MFFGLALVLSCTKEGPTTVNKIENLYTVPADAVEMSALTASNSTWSVDRRYFDLTFGTALSTTLVGYDAFLTPGQYVLGGDEIGKALLAKTTVNGAAAKEGFITVNRDGTKYMIDAQIDGTVLVWSGELPFVADPAPVSLTVLQLAQKNNGSVTVQLATEGISKGYDASWQEVWTGEGNFLALDLYSSDGYLHEGNYTASAVGGVINAGEFGIGYDTTVDWGSGPMEMKDWGSCWWTVANGAATATKLLDGLVVVSSREEKVDEADVTVWTIYWGKNYPKEYLFEGVIPALTKPKKPSGPVVPDYLYTETVTPGEGVDTHAVTITDKDGNELAYLELLTANGASDLAGDYPSTSYASEPGQMRDGYYIDAGDFGIFSGGSWYMDGAEKKYIGAGSATVTVTKIAEGAYDFTCEFFSYACAGPDYVPGGDIEALDATEELGEPADGVVKHTITMKNSGELVAVFELLVAAGESEIAGSYTCASYASQAGQVCDGYYIDAGDFGVFQGGSYYMKDGERVNVLPGETLEVTKIVDGVYQFVGSTNYEFTCRIQK